MFGLEPTTALRVDDLLMERRFAEVIRTMEARLAAAPNPWDRYFLALARFLGQDTRNALVDMMTLLSQQVNRITECSPQELEVLAGWGMQLAQMAETPPPPQSREVDSFVELGLSMAEVAITLLGRLPNHLMPLPGLLERLWVAEGPQGRIVRRYLRPVSPYLLQVEPTNHCNLGCVMCPRRKMTRELGFLDLDLWRRILETWQHRGGSHVLDNLAMLGQSRFRIGYHGVVKLFFMGEPLLHKRLPDLVRMAHDYGAQVWVQTNGVLLENAKVRERLLDAAPDGVGVSIDGIDTLSYERVRVNAKWEDLVRGLQALDRERRARGMAQRLPVRVSTILSENSPAKRAQALAFLRPLQEWIDEVDAITLNREWEPAYLNDQGTGLAAYSRRAKGGVDPLQPRCSEPMTRLNVLWDGTITPCSTDVNGVTRLGHVNDPGGIDGVWNGEKVLALQQAFFHHQPTGQSFCEACLS